MTATFPSETASRTPLSDDGRLHEINSPIEGAILGCAVGDALGLPYERLSRRRGTKLLGEADRHRFLLRHGMVSDDTEHTCMVAQALCEHPDDPKAFARALARRFRWWLLSAPAGIGFATLRSILKLWLGFSPNHSGVSSAGNGPAMRSAVLGAAIADLQTLEQFVHRSTRLTHTDPKAEVGAQAVALAAWTARHAAANERPASFLTSCQAHPLIGQSAEFLDLLAKVEASLAAGESTRGFADTLGCSHGVSGYVYHTVPVSLHAWLRHPDDFRTAVTEVICCGGDTDTTAAIVGGIMGSGPCQIPCEWLERLIEWPRTVTWMRKVAAAANKATQTRQSVRPPELPHLIGFVRNFVFFSVVLLHLLRRALPPY